MTTESQTPEEAEALMSIMCLYLEVDAVIADDVHKKVLAAFAAIRKSQEKRAAE